MPGTTSNLPICIHCGTPRPADETKCPKCGRPWIDIQVGPPPAAPPAASAAAATAAAGVAASAQPAAPSQPPSPAPPLKIHDTGEFGMDEWTLPPEPPSSKAIWLLPLALLAAVVAFWAFVYFGGDSSPTTTLAVAPTTTTSTTSTTVAVVVDETTTTSSTTTTTTVPYPAADEWQASGSAIPAAELTLKASGIGELALGATIEDITGRLISSLGAADAAGDADLCPPDESYWLQWGHLRVIFDGYQPGSSFVSYRYEDTGEAASFSLATLSGIELGDTVADLQSIYSSYTVTFEVINDQDHFRLVDGGDLLLWGPVSSTDASGTVLGIYSPSPCPTS